MADDAREDRFQLGKDFGFDEPMLKAALVMVEGWSDRSDDPEAGLAEALSNGWFLSPADAARFIPRARRLLEQEEPENPDTAPTGPLPQPPR